MKSFLVCSLRRYTTVFVDDDDFEKVTQYKYFIKTKGDIYTKGAPGGEQSLGTLILGRKSGFIVDHINRNKSDNRKENLRHVNAFESAQNKPKRKDNSTGFRGVILDKRSGKCYAQLGHYGIYYRKPYRNTIIEAAIDYNNLVQQHNSLSPLNEIPSPV